MKQMSNFKKKISVIRSIWELREYVLANIISRTSAHDMMFVFITYFLTFRLSLIEDF